MEKTREKEDEKEERSIAKFHVLEFVCRDEVKAGDDHYGVNRKVFEGRVGRMRGSGYHLDI